MRNLFVFDAVKQESFDTVFYPGGHGPMWDLAEDKNSFKLIEYFLVANKPIALVCRAPGALRPLKTRDGKPLVQGKKITGFAEGEEAIRSAVRAGMRIFICGSRETMNRGAIIAIMRRH